jgi:ferredoxin
MKRDKQEHCENCGGRITPLEGVIPDFCSQVCFEAALIRKIRRRIEDRLRKSTDEDVLAVARILGIPEEF